MEPGKPDRLLDNGAKLWIRVRTVLAERPAQFIGYMLGSLALLFVGGYLLTTSYTNNNELDKIQRSFCKGDARYTQEVEKRCHRLLDQLLRNPTPTQTERLREIVKDTT